MMNGLHVAIAINDIFFRMHICELFLDIVRFKLLEVCLTLENYDKIVILTSIHQVELNR